MRIGSFGGFIYLFPGGRGATVTDIIINRFNLPFFCLIFGQILRVIIYTQSAVNSAVISLYHHKKLFLLRQYLRPAILHS